MRVVLDTNVLISSVLSRSGPPFEVLRRWDQGRFELVTSDPLLAEYRKVLGYDHIRAIHRSDDVALDRRIARIRHLSTVVAPASRLDIVEHDESDNRFLECAVAGEAAFVVSGDRHLLSVGEYRGIRVLTPAAFVAYLDSISRES